MSETSSRETGSFKTFKSTGGVGGPVNSSSGGGILSLSESEPETPSAALFKAVLAANGGIYNKTRKFDNVYYENLRNEEIINRGQESDHNVKTAEEMANEEGTIWEELELNGNMRKLSPSLFEQTNLTHLYINHSGLTKLPPEIVRLCCLEILDASNNKLTALPIEIGDLSQLQEFQLTNNCLKNIPLEICKLFNLRILNIQGNPLPEEMLNIHAQINGTRKLIKYIMEKGTVLPRVPPPPRPWLTLATPSRTRPVCVFTVMCYNILCEKYATREMFPYCQTWALDWSFRRLAIMAELKFYSADILTLQEVAMDVFYNFLLPELRRIGYDGVFAPKSRARTLSDEARKDVDGCAILFRTSKWKLIEYYHMEFEQLASGNSKGSHDMLNRVMNKDNIGLAALLETQDAAWENGVPVHNPPLLVCTTHLHWDPKNCDVKLVQTMMLMNELQLIAQGAEFNIKKSIPPTQAHLLLCGDLNSTPDSGVLEYIQTSRISATHPDFKEKDYAPCLQRITYHTHLDQEYTHPFGLSSAYPTDVMPFTNYTIKFKGIIDYVFYSRSCMCPLGLLGPTDPTWIKENKVIGAPNPSIPSDHFPIMVELEMTSGIEGSPGYRTRR